MFISIILLFIFNELYSYTNFLSPKPVFKADFFVNYENQEKQSKDQNMNLNPEVVTKEANWYLEIPIIKLKADIEEGTTKEVMDRFIGHFEESRKWVGNVCLAAHNRGYENNYFSEVKQLKKGDKINYHYNGEQKEYTVEKNDIIKATDLSCLENTEENRITLITCVENEPDYRRCIKAIEK